MMFYMHKKKGEKGLTLIELLVTIAVIAIVAAISVPVISNVVGSSRDNAAAVMQKQVDSFVAKYDKAGKAQYIENVADGSGAKSNKRLTGFVDLNGDGDYADENELIETFVVGDEYDIDVTGTAALEDGVNTVDDITAITVKSAGGSANAAVAAGFQLAANGITITCYGMEDGDTGVINGVTYTKRSRTMIAVDSNRTPAATSCTSGITDMKDMFFNAALGFNADISHWDTSNVTNMNGILSNNRSFTQDLSNWVTNNVKTNAGWKDGTSSWWSQFDKHPSFNNLTPTSGSL
jgi:prepilin-type N-terminal cleavage/methylation domain-containing protein